MKINLLKQFSMLALLVIASSVLLLTTAQEAHASVQVRGINTLGEAINQAGRQRMLTQRIVKAYAMELLNVQSRQARQQREQAIALYDQQLTNLKSYSPGERVNEALAIVTQQWSSYRLVASGEVSEAGLRELVTMNDDMLRASHQVVVILEELSGDNVGHLVNISGRQRMLSQRIAMYYMLRSLGLEDEVTRTALNKASGEFIAALQELNDAGENTAEIQQALYEVERQWRVFEAGFGLKDGNTAPMLIALSSERVLQGMNRITGMYAVLGSKSI